MTIRVKIDDPGDKLGFLAVSPRNAYMLARRLFFAKNLEPADACKITIVQSFGEMYGEQVTHTLTYSDVNKLVMINDVNGVCVSSFKPHRFAVKRGGMTVARVLKEAEAREIAQEQTERWNAAHTVWDVSDYARRVVSYRREAGKAVEI